MSLRIGDSNLLGALALGDANYIDDLADVGAAFRVAPPPGAMGYGMPFPSPYRVPAPGGTMVPAARLIPTVPGAPKVGLRLQPLGFSNVTFGAATGTALSTTARPQRPFKAKRLVIGIARTGTSATGLVTVTSLNIGTNNQFVSTGPISADAFAPNAYDTNMELAACTTALDITLGLAISAAPAMTDTVVVNGALIGEAIG